MTHTDAVIGLDITTRGISVVRYTGHRATPRCGYLPGLSDLGDFTPDGTRDIADRLARKLVRGLNDPQDTRLVVLNKLTVDSMRQDPSGPRRAGLWWAVVRALGDAELPAVEAPPLLSLLRFVDRATGSGFTQAQERMGVKVREHWPKIAYPADEHFRPSAVLHAAVGCMILGIPTPIRVTPTRRKLLERVPLPDGLALSETVADETDDADAQEAS